MANSGKDPIAALREFAESPFKQIKLGGGVVGRTCYGIIALCAVWGGIVWRFGDRTFFAAICLDVSSTIAIAKIGC